MDGDEGILIADQDSNQFLAVLVKINRSLSNMRFCATFLRGDKLSRANCE